VTTDFDEVHAVDEVSEEHRFLRFLGDELRAARKRGGWTRRDVIDRLGYALSMQTMSTYERGTRACSVVRLWQLGVALDEPAGVLLARAAQRMIERDRVGVEIDLRAAAKVPDHGWLSSLRAWARVRLRNAVDGAARTTFLDEAALETLAPVCGLTVDGLLTRLHRARLVRDHTRSTDRAPDDHRDFGRRDAGRHGAP
jgi:transcriptional regulator with XRE-family HTH domain